MKLEYQFTGERGDVSGWISAERLPYVAFVADVAQILALMPGQTFVDSDGDVWECRKSVA